MSLQLRLFLFGTASAVLGACLATGAAAQTAAAANDRDVAGIAEIVVTARKQSESLVAVPVAVTALSAAALESRGINGYVTLSDFVPGFKYESQSINRNDRGYTHFTVRGMYPGTPTSERQGVGTFIDGTPIGSSSTAGLTDVEQIEVIKGPQSAYFGRSTFSGAINFITRAPSFDPQVRADLSYASFNTIETKGSVEGGLIPDVLAVRLSGRYFKTDGQYENFGYGGKLGAQETRSVGLSVLVTPTPNLKLRSYTTYWQDRDGPPASGQFQPADFNCTTPTGRPYYCGGISSVPTNRLTQQTGIPSSVIYLLNGVTSPPNSNVLPPAFIEGPGLNRNAVLTLLSADYSFGGGYTLSGSASYFNDRFSFVTDTGFRDGRGQANPNFGTPAGTAAGVLPYFSRTVSGQTNLTDHFLELRVSAPEQNRLRWLAGLSYFQQHNALSTLAFSNTGFAIASRPTNFDTRNYAAFGSVTYDISEPLSLSLEGRYQSDHIEQSTPFVNLFYAGTFKNFAPRAILRYEFSDDMSVYASYAEGTRPGQFNTFLYQLPAATVAQVNSIIPVPKGVDPEKLKMEEIGFKGYLFERRLRILAAAYYGDWENKHVTQTVGYTVPITQTVAVTTAGGKVKVYGFELEASYKLNSNWSFDANLNLAETDIRSTVCADCTLLLGSPAATGNRLPQYPAWAGALGATYRQPVGAGWDAFARADYIYTGKQYLSESNINWIDAAHRVNVRVGVENDKYRAELFADNLFDEDVPVGGAHNTDTYSGLPTVSLSPAIRRTVGVKLGLKL